MDPVLIQLWSESLADNFATFPDYIIHRLATAGIGRVEAEPRSGSNDVVWRYAPHHGPGEPQIFAKTAVMLFRPTLARWAVLARADPYISQRQFAVQAHPNWPHQVVHGFSLFQCNEPTMGYWFKLYLYAIDNVWPTRGGKPAQGTPAARITSRCCGPDRGLAVYCSIP